MKTAKIHVLAFAIVLGLVGALAARPAVAQCIPDPPAGSIVVRNCGEVLAARPTPTAPVAIVASVPVTVFAGNPIVATVSWMVSRPMTTTSARSALRPSRYAVVRLREGRAPKPAGW